MKHLTTLWLEQEEVQQFWCIDVCVQVFKMICELQPHTLQLQCCFCIEFMLMYYIIVCFVWQQNNRLKFTLMWMKNIRWGAWMKERRNNTNSEWVYKTCALDHHGKLVRLLQQQPTTKLVQTKYTPSNCNVVDLYTTAAEYNGILVIQQYKWKWCVRERAFIHSLTYGWYYTHFARNLLWYNVSNKTSHIITGNFRWSDARYRYGYVCYLRDFTLSGTEKTTTQSKWNHIICSTAYEVI